MKVSIGNHQTLDWFHGKITGSDPSGSVLNTLTHLHLLTCVSHLFPADDHKFSEATAVLFTWIDRGEVNRRSANHFYSMIQSANSHVRRLMSEKAQHEEEMERAKEAFKNALLAILTQCKDTSVFEVLCSNRHVAVGTVAVIQVSEFVPCLITLHHFRGRPGLTAGYRNRNNKNNF